MIGPPLAQNILYPIS